MKRYIYIGFGGALGAILRFVFKNIELSGIKEIIPFDTLAINISGSFVLALIFAATYKLNQINENVKLSITTGFLGALTTFSTMSKEITLLINQQKFYFAFLYSGLSTFLGVGAAYLGYMLGEHIVYSKAIIKERSKEKANDNLVEGDD